MSKYCVGYAGCLGYGVFTAEDDENQDYDSPVFSSHNINSVILECDRLNEEEDDKKERQPGHQGP